VRITAAWGRLEAASFEKRAFDWPVFVFMTSFADIGIQNCKLGVGVLHIGIGTDLSNDGLAALRSAFRAD